MINKKLHTHITEVKRLFYYFRYVSIYVFLDVCADKDLIPRVNSIFCDDNMSLLSCVA